MNLFTKCVHLWQDKAKRDHQEALARKFDESAKRVRTSAVEVAEAANVVTQLLVEKPPSPEAVLLCDVNGVVIKCNLQSAELFLADVNNHRISELLHFPDNEDWRSVIALAPSMEKTIAMAAVPYSGMSFPAEVTMVRLADTPPAVPRVLMLVRRAADAEMRERFRDVAERVQNALDHINDRYVGGAQQESVDQ